MILFSLYIIDLIHFCEHSSKILCFVKNQVKYNITTTRWKLFGNRIKLMLVHLKK